MLAKTILRNRALFSRSFSSVQAHKTHHKAEVMNPKFYERDFLNTSIEEIEYIRSPLYDLAKEQTMTDDQLHDFLDDYGLKQAMISEASQFLMSPQETAESVAFKRYQDEVTAPEDQKHIFQHPRGEPLRRSEPGALFRMHKPENHWENVRRSKSYIADDFFPPVELKTGNLIEIFAKDAWRQDPESAEFLEWRDAVVEMCSKLNFDAVVELALYLSFEAKLNDKQIWKAVESAALENLHLYELKHTCQLQWAVTQLKPKYTSSRFDNMLANAAGQVIDTGDVTAEDFHNIF